MTNLSYSHQYAKFYKTSSRIATSVLKRDTSIEIKGLSNGTARMYMQSTQRVKFMKNENLAKN